jgi:hypothetical protein
MLLRFGYWPPSSESHLHPRIQHYLTHLHVEWDQPDWALEDTSIYLNIVKERDPVIALYHLTRLTLTSAYEMRPIRTSQIVVFLPNLPCT